MPPTPTVLETYQRHAPAWATLRGTHLIESPWLDRFCALLPPAAEILDIGCGAGHPLAAELLRRGHALTGIDGSPAMLALFHRNLPNTPAHLMDMRHLALGRRFAGLLAWDSFFHLSPDDQRATIPRFAAHAAPGAPLMFTSGDTEGEAIGDLEGTPLYHASLDPAEYRSRLQTAGFTVLAHASKDPTCRRTIWLARRDPAQPGTA